MGAAIVFNNDEHTVILDRSFEEVLQGINEAKQNKHFFEYTHMNKKFAVNPESIRLVREKK